MENWIHEKKQLYGKTHYSPYSTAYPGFDSKKEPLLVLYPAPFPDGTSGFCENYDLVDEPDIGGLTEHTRSLPSGFPEKKPIRLILRNVGYKEVTLISASLELKPCKFLTEIEAHGGRRDPHGYSVEYPFYHEKKELHNF